MPIHTSRSPIRLPRALRRAAQGLAQRALGAVGEPLVAMQPQVEGLDHLPSNGAAIIASRHSGLLDARLLNAVSPRSLTLIDVPVRLAGPAPWASGEPDGQDALATRLLAKGELILVFPEGRKSPDDLLHKGRTGLGALVLSAQVPVIPAAVVTQGLTSTVLFGAPLDFSRHAGVPIDRTLARGVTDEVMAAIADLAGLDYADSYTSTARDLLKDQARERVQARRARAAAQREADRLAIQRHRQQVAEEVEDLARRVAEAADQARHHAERAAQRDHAGRGAADQKAPASSLRHDSRPDHDSRAGQEARADQDARAEQ